MSNNEQWRWLWRLQIPQRCKIFLWLALNESLPTNAPARAPCIVNFIASKSCPFCHGHETLLHVLRDCPRAKNTWIHLVAPRHQDGFFSCSLWDWMVTYLQQPWSIVDSNDCVLFAATVWLLWKDRKTLVFDGHSFSLERSLHRMSDLAYDYGRVVEVEHCTPSPAVRYASWCFYWNQPPSQLQLRSVADNSQVVFSKL